MDLIKIGKFILRFTKFDVTLGQNDLVHVIASYNGGKTYQRIGGAMLEVSRKARFTFIDKLNGFAINNGMIRLSDSYGMKVTNDGGLTFKYSEFKYKNNSTEYLNIIDVPYLERDILKLKCSIFLNTHEKQEIIFVSKDNGLTWLLE